MRVTFTNQLALAGPEEKDIVRYKHPFRVNVDIYIRENQCAEQDWEILFCPHNQETVPMTVRDALTREFTRYIRQRVKRRTTSLCFEDFINMANAMNIAG